MYRGLYFIQSIDAAFLLAWGFLNLLVNLNYSTHEPHSLAPLLPSPEIAALLASLYAVVWLGMPFHHAVYVPLTCVLIFLRLFLIADVLVPMYFNRNFNLYIRFTVRGRPHPPAVQH